MSVHEAIDAAVRRREVPGAVLEEAFREVAAGAVSEVEIAALLVALRTKGETPGEIVAAVRALRQTARTPPAVDPRTIDTAGTGGDGAGTFNISTAAAFVVAGAGLPVAKHGNRAVSSKAGSIDVLEALGVRVDLPVDVAVRILAEVGLAAFFARRLYPAMRHVAPVRQALGIRTLMNCIGPLLNPLGLRHQLVGVYARELLGTIAEALSALGAERALVVHGSDGLDEITTTGPTHAALLSEGGVRMLTIDPTDFDLPRASPEDLRGGDASANAAVVRAVLGGEPGPRRDVVLVNAGAALWVGGAAADLGEGLLLARESIETGAALEKLERLVRATGDAEVGP